MSVNVQRLFGRSSASSSEGGSRVSVTSAGAAQAGFLAALLMLVAQLAWRLIDDAPVPAFPELVVAAVARLTPIDVFGEVTETYGSLAKKTLFVSVLIAILAVGAWAGGTAGRLTARTGRGIGGRLVAGGVGATGLFLVVG